MVKLKQDPIWMKKPSIQKIVSTLDGNVRFVGGCVRDLLSNRVSHDIDLATPLTPERVMELCAASGIDFTPTGLKHGTITIHIDRENFEITTLRRDVSTDGRHADVEFTDDWKEDAARRDFTINAMSIAPDGTIFDYFDGLKDLRLGRVRFVGNPDDRIAEDYLRVFRFFRFYARFAADGKCMPDMDALIACKKASNRLQGLSGERVRSEIFKIMKGPSAEFALKLMKRAGVLSHWLPEMKDIDIFSQLGFVLHLIDRQPDEIGLFASILFECSKNQVHAVADRFRLSNVERRKLVALTAAETLLEPNFEDKAMRSAFYRADAYLPDAILHAWARAIDPIGYGNFGPLYLKALTWESPKFPLGGADAHEAGIEPGPAVGKWLREMEELWIQEGCTEDKETLLGRVAYPNQQRSFGATP